MGKNLKSKKAPNNVRAKGLRFGIVASQFNDSITERLLAGAVEALKRAGATNKQIQIVRVPGAFELPIAAKKMAMTAKYDSIICIGCVIRGETSHYEYVCSETARGILLAQLDTGVPMIFCVLTCDTSEQAMERAGGRIGNKGFDSGVAAVEMGLLMRKLGTSKSVLQTTKSGTARKRR